MHACKHDKIHGWEGCEKCAEERGFRAGIEAAAKVVEASARPHFDRSGREYLAMQSVAIIIRSLSPAEPGVVFQSEAAHDEARMAGAGADSGPVRARVSDLQPVAPPHSERCPGCNGHGWLYLNDSARKCLRCHGTGTNAPPWSLRAPADDATGGR